MNIINTPLDGVTIIELKAYTDPRGFFVETHHLEKYREHGISQNFVQDNLSYSVQHTLRGLHYQLKKPQAKLVQVITGEIFDVALDIRIGSDTFGQWTAAHLTAENRQQMFVPEGFAHGFCVVSKNAHVLYKCSDFYSPDDEGGILWSDPDLGIDWPVKNPIISEKDGQFLPLSKQLPDELPLLEESV